MGYLKTKQPFLFCFLLCTEMCNVFGADFAVSGKADVQRCSDAYV